MDSCLRPVSFTADSTEVYFPAAVYPFCAVTHAEVCRQNTPASALSLAASSSTCSRWRINAGPTDSSFTKTGITAVS